MIKSEANHGSTCVDSWSLYRHLMSSRKYFVTNKMLIFINCEICNEQDDYVFVLLGIHA